MSPDTRTRASKGAVIYPEQEPGVTSGEITLCAAVIESAVSDLRRDTLKDSANTATLKPRIADQSSAVAFFTGENSNFPWMIAAIGAHADVVVDALRDDIKITQRQIDRMVKLVYCTDEEDGA